MGSCCRAQRRENPQPNHHFRCPKPRPLGSYQHPPTRVRCTVTNRFNPKYFRGCFLRIGRRRCRRMPPWPMAWQASARAQHPSFCRTCISVQSGRSLSLFCVSPPGRYLDILHAASVIALAQTTPNRPSSSGALHYIPHPRELGLNPGESRLSSLHCAARLDRLLTARPFVTPTPLPVAALTSTTTTTTTRRPPCRDVKLSLSIPFLFSLLNLHRRFPELCKISSLFHLQG